MILNKNSTTKKLIFFEIEHRNFELNRACTKTLRIGVFLQRLNKSEIHIGVIKAIEYLLHILFLAVCKNSLAFINCLALSLRETFLQTTTNHFPLLPCVFAVKKTQKTFLCSLAVKKNVTKYLLINKIF